MELNVYAVTTPVILAVIAAEIAYCLWERNGYYHFDDSVANLGTAVANQVVNVPVHWAAFQAYSAVHSRFALFAWDDGWSSWAVLLLALDFLFYWFHRAGHRVPLFWAAHAPHHSSEELNYTVGARSSATQRAASFLFYWPACVLGFPADKVIAAVALHLLWQLWPHTRAIKRLPAWFEAVFNSPTHHRVHHGINERYIDKNYGGVLIVWDKLFGTYEPETEEVVYGVKPQLRTWSPIAANVQFWASTWRESVDSGTLRGWLMAWLVPADWRRPSAPANLPESKYRTPIVTRMKWYLSAQVVLAMPLMLMVTRSASPLSPWAKLAAGFLVWAAAVAWAGLLERRSWATWLERGRQAKLIFTLPFLGAEPWVVSVLGLGAAASFLLLGACVERAEEICENPRDVEYRRRPGQTPRLATASRGRLL